MLKPLREFVCAVAHTLGFTEQQVSEIEICVDEACANAIEHAYTGPYEREFPNDQRDIFIEMTFHGDELMVRVIDHGQGGDAGVHQKIRDLAEYLDNGREKFRGLGLYLMNKYMDKVTVHTAPGKGTTVEMTKYRR